MTAFQFLKTVLVVGQAFLARFATLSMKTFASKRSRSCSFRLSPSHSPVVQVSRPEQFLPKSSSCWNSNQRVRCKRHQRYLHALCDCRGFVLSCFVCLACQCHHVHTTNPKKKSGQTRTWLAAQNRSISLPKFSFVYSMQP